MIGRVNENKEINRSWRERERTRRGRMKVFMTRLVIFRYYDQTYRPTLVQRNRKIQKAENQNKKKEYSDKHA